MRNSAIAAIVLGLLTSFFNEDYRRPGLVSCIFGLLAITVWGVSHFIQRKLIDELQP